TMPRQVAAEGLGGSIGRAKIVAADTDLTPIDIGSYSSRVTFMAGNATLRAAEEVKKQIASAAARKMNCAPEELVFRDDLIFRGDDFGKRFAGEGARATQSETSVSGRVEGQILRGSLQQKRRDEGPKDQMTFEEAVVAAIDSHGALTGTGSYAPPLEARGGKHKGAGVGPSPAYSYSAQVAEVTVDEETGEVTEIGRASWRERGYMYAKD